MWKSHAIGFVRVITYVLIPLMLCALTLYMSGRTYYLKSTPKERFLRNFSGHFCLFPEFLQEVCLEEGFADLCFHVMHLVNMVFK